MTSHGDTMEVERVSSGLYIPASHICLCIYHLPFKLTIISCNTYSRMYLIIQTLAADFLFTCPLFNTYFCSLLYALCSMLYAALFLPIAFYPYIHYLTSMNLQIRA